MTAFSRSHTAARIRAAATRGTLSHALILSGPGDRAAAALYAAAAFECASEGDRPCLACAHCRKVLSGIHPDVAFVRDPEHKELSAETVRAMRSDTFIRPNEGERKVYIFEDCAILNEKDQNILLKTVEEGPPYCAFLFCAENSAVLLQTIRSRCVEIKLGEEAGAQEGEREAALAFCHLIAKGNAASRTAFLVKLENRKPGRDELGAFFEDARLVAADTLLGVYGAPTSSDTAEVCTELAQSLTKAKILGTIDLLDTYRRHCSYNVGVGLTLGGFAAELEEVLR
ncbi:MAG: DNA polymerase III subunit delta' [Ruminococcaceae bacterium]|nr:DNA polymerase III subunit delta' [Oscillospiraceae bacterium]